MPKGEIPIAAWFPEFQIFSGVHGHPAGEFVVGSSRLQSSPALDTI
jgi:hypothetical protein